MVATRQLPEMDQPFKKGQFCCPVFECLVHFSGSHYVLNIKKTGHKLCAENDHSNTRRSGFRMVTVFMIWAEIHQALISLLADISLEKWQSKIMLAEF
jgi:hypothetical protein